MSQMPDVGPCPRGAPMGRDESKEYAGAPVRCFRLRMVDYDYDDGGAYWGGWSESTGAVYCATDGSDFRLFTRAKTREDAKAKFLKREPTIRWIN